MINIDKYKKFVYLEANKSGRGTLSPTEFNSTAKSSLYAWTNNQVSNQKQYQPNQPISQTSLDVDQLAIEKLKHLKETYDIRVINGLMSTPNGVNTDVNGVIMPDMWIYSRMLHKYQSNGRIANSTIEVVKDSEWGLRLESSIVFPTKSRAIANFQNNHLLIEPANLINLVNFTYVRNPIVPEWKYTVVNGRPLYDSVNSVDLDAPESAMNEIAMINLELIAMRIREQELGQSAANLEQKGI